MKSIYIKHKRRAIIIALVTLVILLAVGGYLWKQSDSNNSSTEGGRVAETVNLDPPTDEEKSAGDNVDVKQNTPPTNGQQSGQGGQQQGINSASVAFSDASVYDGQVEVRAFVSNVIADGTCTYTFTANGGTLTKTKAARADASTTTCVTLNFDASELSDSQRWTVDVKYENQQKTVTGTARTTMNI